MSPVYFRVLHLRKNKQKHHEQRCHFPITLYKSEKAKIQTHSVKNSQVTFTTTQIKTGQCDILLEETKNMQNNK